MHWFAAFHPGQPLAPHDVWTAWNMAPALLLPLAATVLAYLWGIRRLWRRAGIGRGIRVGRCLCFLVAMLALVAALMSPLEAMSGALFWAHMSQHLLLIMVAAPLLVLSELPLALLWALPRGWAQALGRGLHQSPALTRAWRAVSSPVSAWVLFGVALWAWHAPGPYQAALLDEVLHAWEHLAFVVTAVLFWWVLLKSPGPSIARYTWAIPYLFTSALHSGLLGALMTFTSQPWYPYYALRVIPWGLTPLQDHQLAGLIMWLPGGAVFSLLTIGYFAAWLRALEQRSARLQRAGYSPSSSRNAAVTAHAPLNRPGFRR